MTSSAQSVSESTPLLRWRRFAPRLVAHRIGRALFFWLRTIQGLGAFSLIALGVLIRKHDTAGQVIRPLLRREIARAGSRLLPMFLFMAAALGLVVIGQSVSWLTRVGAINYLGVHGGSESRAVLGEVYASSSDVDVKRRILRAFMVSGEKARLLNAAQTEKDPTLRQTAVEQLGVMGAHDELWQLYQKESSTDVKRSIIRATAARGSP